MSEVLAARWRRIYPREWHDPAFQNLSNDDRVVYFYARTGGQSTSVGIYRMSTAVAVEDIGNLTSIEFDARLNAVCVAFNWRFDAPTRVLWIPTWLDENPPQSPNVCVSWRKLIGNLPDCDLKFEAAAAIIKHLRERPKAFLEAFGSLPKDIRNSKAKPEPQPEANQGAGDSGIQGAGSRGAGARRAGAGKSKSNGRPFNDDLLRAGRETLRFVLPQASDDELVDNFHFVTKGAHLRLKRADILALLHEVSSS